MNFPGPAQIKLDDKARIAIPVRYRNELLESWGKRLISTIDLYERILVLYPFRYWEEEIMPAWSQLSSIDPQASEAKRRFLGSATEVIMDNAGRIRLPSVLMAYAHITTEVDLRRLGNKFEISAVQPDILEPLDKSNPLAEVLQNLKT